MKHSAKLFFFFLFLAQTLHAEREKIDFSLVISGGVSLGAYEAGYNWALIKMLAKAKATDAIIDPQMQSVSGASAGSINALLSAMYWCQKDTVPLRNSVDDNLFYETWVNLGIEDLAIIGKDAQNKSSLFTQEGLKKKGDIIIEHLKQPIFKKNCEVPLGVAVTKVTPITETVQGIKIKNQNFSVPLVFKEKNGQGIIENKTLPASTAFYLSIPGIEKDRKKVINLLLASGAFPGAFQQVKLEYQYKGKVRSNYFIDGGLYDNVPLDLAIALNNQSTYFFFMDPSNMRKETIEDKEEEEVETLPTGFITTNLLPVFDSFEIMQSMKLYQAINTHFTGKTNKKLILSSRYLPITGKYLGHFGAFLDENFRTYDYYVGVYDAIYHLSAGLQKNYPQKFANLSQIDIMNYLKNTLGIDKNPEALAAYTLFLDIEFHHAKPETNDRFSAIYNAFDVHKIDNKRYDTQEFENFLSKLDMRYLKQTPNSFLAYAKKDVSHWYKRPLRTIVNRITTLENDKDEVEEEGNSLAVVTNLGAWAGSTFLKEKNGLQLFPLDVPQDEGKVGLRTALRLLPGEIATDLLNGGMSLAYTGIYYSDMGLINGFEAKAAYVVSDKTNNFVRVDMDAFKEFDDLFKFGAGVSAFGDMEGSFYQQDTAYGANAYVDIVDIFRLSYVYRQGSSVETENNYLYFGVENIPALIYWLSR